MKTDLGELVFEEPPRSGPGRGWRERTAPLRDRPGEWARVATFEGDPKRAYRTAGYLRESFAGELSWEFRARTVDGSGVVYARYLDRNGS